MDSTHAEESVATDELFLERLEAFTEKTLSDVKIFAEREGYPVDIVRRHVAEQHSKYLFDLQSPLATSRRERITSILSATSKVLSSLEESAGLQSFFLVVDPGDPNDDGFLGGTVLGREFWRGLRSGGVSGARSFKAQARAASLAAIPSEQPSVTVSPGKGPAYKLKTEVYARVRNALRAVSGIRNADMKWTNHDRLNVYGVRIEGWPAEVPLQNPSSLSTVQNKLLKDCLDNGTLRFCRLAEPPHETEQVCTPASQVSVDSTDQPDAGDISWAIADDPSTSYVDVGSIQRTASSGSRAISQDISAVNSGELVDLLVNAPPSGQERSVGSSETSQTLYPVGDIDVASGGLSSRKRKREIGD